jgi:hypothetical protein
MTDKITENAIETFCIELLEKTTDLSKVTGFEMTTLVVIGTNRTGSYNSNYHAIKSTMAPVVLIVMMFVVARCKKSHGRISFLPCFPM